MLEVQATDRGTYHCGGVSRKDAKKTAEPLGSRVDEHFLRKYPLLSSVQEQFVLIELHESPKTNSALQVL